MSIRTTLLAAALALSLSPVSAQETTPVQGKDLEAARAELRDAQEELREVTRRIAEISARLGADAAENAFAFSYLADSRRALVGVVLGAEDGQVVLDAVTPGGPAEKAGLKPGDRIVSINGEPVPAAKEGSVAAARALIGELSDGDTVRIGYERDGKRRDVEVVAERRESWSWPVIAGDAIWSSRVPLESLGPTIDEIEIIVSDAMESTEKAGAEAHARHGDRGDIERAIRDARREMRDARREMRRVMVFNDGAWTNLRLVELNPDLGRYFGADDGVLVLERGGDGFAELRPGDVLLAVDGKRVDGAADVMRAFGSREKGDAVNVELMRDRKREVIVVTVPERGNVLMPLPPLPPEPPVAPAAPKASAAPGARPAAPAPPAPPTPPAPPPGGGLAAIVHGDEV